MNQPIAQPLPAGGGQIFGVAPTPQQPNYAFPGFFDMFGGGVRQQAGPDPQYAYQHGPLGSIAAFKGDLLYPAFNIGFFLVGVIVVVKLIFYILALIKAKLSAKLLVPAALLLGGKGVAAGVGLGALDSTEDEDILGLRRRKKRAATDALQSQVDGLTAIVMTALDSQECIQRLTCEIGTFVQKYDTTNVIAG